MTDLLEVETTFDDVNDFARHYFDDVPRVALAVYKEYGTSEPDDITQSIWETVVRDFDNTFNGVTRDEAMKRFRRLGRNYTWQESLDYMHFSGNYVYSPGDVRRLLADVVWRDPETLDEVEHKVDLQTAFASLTLKRKRAIYKRYGLGVPVKELSKAEQRATYEGVDAMTAFLNRGTGEKALRLDHEVHEL